MPEFLYMVETSSGGLPEAVARRVGLLDKMPKGIRSKPYDGNLGRGVLCVHESNVSDSRFCVDLDRQEWTVETVEGFNVHVGMWLDWIPTEHDLRRERVLDSDPVAIGREVWLVPRLRAADGVACLPRAFVAGGGGDSSVTRRVAREYRHLDRCGDRLFRQWQIENELRDEGLDPASSEYGREVVDRMRGDAVTLADQAQIATEALSANYRVGPSEVGLLELVTEHSLPDITAALLCKHQLHKMLQLLELEKKIRDAVEREHALAELEERARAVASADAGGVGAGTVAGGA